MFFYDKQFDHTIWRLSDVVDIDSCASPDPPKRLGPNEMTMLDGFSGMGTVALAGKASGLEVSQLCILVGDRLPAEVYKYILNARRFLSLSDG